MWRLLIPVLLVAGLLVVWLQGRDQARSGREVVVDEPLTVREVREGEARPEAPVSIEHVVIATLRGRVFDPNGRPVENASVFILEPEPIRLAKSDAEGNYELPLHERRSHLLEASLHIDLGPARRRLAVPGEGDPSPLDFHLEPTGTVFGELTSSGEPVVQAYVDIYRDDEWLLDTETENGFFNFTDEPPLGVPLRLQVKSEAGYPARSVEFTWKGLPLDLGRIELVPFPAVRLELRLPDGTRAEGFEAFSADRVMATRLIDRGMWDLTEPLIVEGDLVRVPPPARRVAVILATQTENHEEEYLVRREIEPGDARIPEIEVRFAKGPVEHECTLLDAHGRPLHVRLTANGQQLETDEEGHLEVALPACGLHQLSLAALRDRQTGQWVTVWRRRPSVILDADRPGEIVRVDFSRRLLILTSGGCNPQFRREIEGRHKFFPVGESAWYAHVAQIPTFALGEAGHVAVISPLLHEGVWHWSRGEWAKDDRGRWNWRHDFENYRDWPRIRFAERGFTIVDAR